MHSTIITRKNPLIIRILSLRSFLCPHFDTHTRLERAISSDQQTPVLRSLTPLRRANQHYIPTILFFFFSHHSGASNFLTRGPARLVHGFRSSPAAPRKSRFFTEYAILSGLRIPLAPSIWRRQSQPTPPSSAATRTSIIAFAWRCFVEG